MKSTVGIFNSHRAALIAVEVLKTISYPVSQLSIMGRAIMTGNRLSGKSEKRDNDLKTNASDLMGSTQGVLSGVGLFAVPGFGYILGAGAVRQMIDDFEAGVEKDGITTILNTFGMRKERTAKYNESLYNGKFLVIVQGNDEEVKNAKHIISIFRKLAEPFTC
jgi:hypothetical protein